MSLYTHKKLLITGGTGSFGRAVLARALSTDVEEIRIFSRDEEKQDRLRHELLLSAPEAAGRVRFYLGDVRDPDSLRYAVDGADYVFHAAALKQVPSCEFFPMEAVKTNIMGTDNLLQACCAAGVRRVICLSTDKAAYPVNAMGLSKAMMEKVAVSRARASRPGGTTVCCTRYGNVLCSRGSVIPLWIDQIRKGEPITVTDPHMTRFIMSMDDAVDLVEYAFEQGENGDILIRKAPACTIEALAEAVLCLFDRRGQGEIRSIGPRHGEKRWETLVTREECARAVDRGSYYRIPMDGRDLNYRPVESAVVPAATEYNSDTARLLSADEVAAKLKELPYIREELRKDGLTGE